MTSNVTRISAGKQNARSGEAERQTRIDLACCYRLVHHFGMSDLIWNHISARIPGSAEHFLINSMGLRYDEITASNLVKIDLQGQVIEGPDDINVTGFIIHSAIHAQRGDVACVLHTHSKAGLGVAALKCGLLPLTQDAMSFYGRISYHDWEGLSTDGAECDRLASSLGDNFVMILRNHGLLTAGRSIGEAFMLMYYLERACQVQLDAMATGQELNLPSPEVCRKAAEQYQGFWPGQYEWPALVRLMDEVDPSYRS